ncbi:ABC transporter permease [Aliamphritea ceti]|uniref:ABC transporter permease n=1 Tax=Aliamphritea ceti TaxID=1524258 RepID=UPI0021C37A5F|nr:ABC transporter permease [Aliamphritea ceti]
MLELFSYGETGWGDELLKGFLITVQLAFVTLPLGLVLGFLTASLSLSKSTGLRSIGVAYTTVMRGLPEILTLFVIYNGVGLLLNLAARYLNPEGGGVEFSPFLAGVIALGLVFGAFAGEVLRGAFQSLDEGQVEAAAAIGMSPWKIFIRVKVPQVWRFALPGLGNLWINLVKDTSLVSIIALDDLMRMTKVAAGFTKLPFNFYLAACLIYWIICILSEIVLSKLEERANRGVKRA